MIIIKNAPESNGAYANQTWVDGIDVPQGYIAMPEIFSEAWEQYKPFVSIDINNGIITSVADNPTARDAQQTAELNVPELLTAEQQIAILSDTLDTILTIILPSITG